MLLYDGNCGFCAASIQFILRHERNHFLRFAALEGDVGTSIRSRHPELSGVDSMIWVEPAAHGRREQVHIRSAAGLKVARYLGGPWRLALVFRFVPAVVRDAVYDLIARHRHRLVSEPAACFVPPPSVRARFSA